MTDQECVSCRKPKGIHECGICSEFVCKSCVERPGSDAFSFLPTVPEHLGHLYYCGACFDREVAGELDVYRETLERAKHVFIFFKTQRKEIPLLKRSRESLSIASCEDRDETILRLAFLSAQAGFNAVIEVDVTAKKVRNAGYQTSLWQGTGVPAQVDEEKLDRQDRLNQIYR